MRLKVEFMTEFTSDVSDSRLIKTTGAFGCNSVANVHIVDSALMLYHVRAERIYDLCPQENVKQMLATAYRSCKWDDKGHMIKVGPTFLHV